MLYRKKKWKIYYLLLPVLLFFSIIYLYPIISSFVISFYKYDPLDKTHPFMGLKNYVNLFKNEAFITSLKNTAIFCIFNVGIGLPIALFLAWLFNKILRFAKIYRTVYFIPVVTSLVVCALIWGWIYQPSKAGLLNFILEKIFGIGPFLWLQDKKLALPSIIAMSIWKTLGFRMVIFSAGLQSIPDTYYEASKVDGAKWYNDLFNITIPLLKPTILFVLVTSLIASSKVFAEIFVMTEGGPLNATRTIVFHIYEEGFFYWNMGKASAAAFIMFIIVAIITIFQLKILRFDR